MSRYGGFLNIISKPSLLLGLEIFKSLTPFPILRDMVKSGVFVRDRRGDQFLSLR